MIQSRCNYTGLINNFLGSGSIYKPASTFTSVICNITRIGTGCFFLIYLCEVMGMLGDKLATITHHCDSLAGSCPIVGISHLGIKDQCVKVDIALSLIGNGDRLFAFRHLNPTNMDDLDRFILFQFRGYCVLAILEGHSCTCLGITYAHVNIVCARCRNLLCEGFCCSCAHVSISTTGICRTTGLNLRRSHFEQSGSRNRAVCLGIVCCICSGSYGELNLQVGGPFGNCCDGFCLHRIIARIPCAGAISHLAVIGNQCFLAGAIHGVNLCV